VSHATTAIGSYSSPGSIVVEKTATARQAAVATPTSANHLSCCRSSPWERRKRTTTDATARTRAVAPTGTSTADSTSAGPRAPPSGLSIPDDCWSSNGPGMSIALERLSTRSATPSHSTGRQRGDGSRPSGTAAGA
jgi:hypothetical protein